MRRASKLLFCLLSFFVPTFPTLAFQMQPAGTEYDRKLAQLDESKVERLLPNCASVYPAQHGRGLSVGRAFSVSERRNSKTERR